MIFKQCLHDWKEVGIETVPSGGMFSTSKEILNVLYCPSCHKETSVTDERLVIEMNKIKVRRESLAVAENTTL